jgi:hypothetical protein
LSGAATGRRSQVPGLQETTFPSNAAIRRACSRTPFPVF